MDNTGSNKQKYLTGELTIAIYMEDTDLSGYVYHGNYLKYFDRAREEILGLKKLSELAKEQIFFTVSKLAVEYKRPSFCGDKLLIKSVFSLGKGPRLCFKQTAYRQIDAGGYEEELVSSADVEVIIINSRGFPQKPPKQLTALFD